MRRPPHHLDDLSPEDSVHLENCISRFEAAWQGGARPALDDYLIGDGPPRRAQLWELIYTDLEYRLKAGEPVRVEDYLSRYPELAADRNVILDLFAGELELRCRAAQLDAEELPRRIPKCGDDLATVVVERPTPKRETSSAKEQRRLGRYVLLEEIGSGAFGTVHKAFDTELRRTVAFKVPHRGSVTEGRFLREVRSAAALRHPGIVAVHDAGQADGLWYLVSEFVAGQTLAERLRAVRPTFRQTAEWVAVLADALAHAHQCGVIHRDVKPSNILLDAEGQPRLTDFGMARRDADDGTATQEGQMMGTPAYMSPEQARGEANRLDARTDVYSLGVVLYELLTGELPFHGNNRMLLRQVLEEEPRLPRRVNDEVPRDLETVCLKAMAKEPARRYAGAAEFAEDLRRFLQDRPVRARPVGTMGRLMRWGRRKPALAAMTVALLLVAALGFAGVTWQWRQAETHLAEADRQRDRARENARQAHLAINDFISIGRNPLLDRTDLSTIRQQIWQTGLKYYGDFLEQDDNDPTFTDPTLRVDTVSAHMNLGFLQYQLGQSDRAGTTYAKAQELWQRLHDEEPDNVSYKLERARTLFFRARIAEKQGRPSEALEVYRQAGELFRALHALSPLTDAARHLATASYLPRRPLAELSCEHLMACYEGMGGLKGKEGHLQEARDFQEQARLCGESYLKEHPDCVNVRYKLMSIYYALVQLEQKRGHTDLALQAHRRGVEIGQRLLELAPGIASYRLLLTNLQQQLASLHRAVGQNEQALLAYQQSDRFLAVILHQDPAHFGARYTQVQNRYHCCSCLHGLGRREEAREICLRAYQLAEQLQRDHPTNPSVQSLLATVCFWLGKLQAETRHQAEAVAAFQQGAAINDRLACQASGEAKWRFMHGTCLHSAGSQLVELKQMEQAADHFRRAAEARDQACRVAPNNLAWHADTAGTWHRLGELEERLEHPQEALTAYQRAIASLRAAKEQRRLSAFLQDEARMLHMLGRDAKDANDTNDAMLP